MTQKYSAYFFTLITIAMVFSPQLLSQQTSAREQIFELVHRAKLALVDHKINDALNCYEQALQQSEAQSDALPIAAIHNLMGLAHELNGEFQRALSRFEQGMELLSNQGDEKAVNVFRSILDRLGRMRKGYMGSAGASLTTDLYRGEIEGLKPFLNRKRSVAQRELAILLLMNDGNMYLQQSQFDQADSIYIKALQLARQSRFPWRVQQLFSNLIWSGIKRDQFDEANAWLDSLKKYSPAALSSKELRNALLAQGLINRKQKHYQQAIADIEKAISFYQQAKDERGHCRALAHLANSYLFMSDFENARNNYLKALQLNQSVKDKETAWFANGGLAKCYYQLKNYEAALEHFKAYFETIEEIEQSFYYDEGKTSFLESQTEMMAAYVTTAITVAEQKQAFGIARPIIEQQRARTLIALQRVGESQDYHEVGHLSVDYVLSHSKRRQWDDLPDMRFFDRRSTGNLVEQRAPGVEVMPDRIRNLPEFQSEDNEQLPLSAIPKTPFLEYYILPEQVVIFVKSPDGKVDGAITKISADSLKNLIADYCSTLEVGDTRGMDISRQVTPIRRRSTARLITELSSQLYQLLIAPVEKYLPNDPQKPIVIVPHYLLWQLPFAALQDEEQNYFGDRHALMYAASDESWHIIAQKPRKADHRNPNAWIVGNPRMPEAVDECGSRLSFHPLPGAEGEARAIAKLFGKSRAHVFTGKQADRLRLEAWHPNFSVLHFATHGFACPEDPLRSFIVMSALNAGELKVDTTSFQIAVTKDARFAVKLDTLPEMMDYSWAWFDLSSITFSGILDALTIIERFHLKVDLVTLSACQTGLGKFLGQGVIGFSRAFLKAGARSLLVSLWRVDDEATKHLMIAFYKQYLNHGNKAVALQSAMQQTRQRFPHPKYWAAFTLIGLAE